MNRLTRRVYWVLASLPLWATAWVVIMMYIDNPDYGWFLFWIIPFGGGYWLVLALVWFIHWLVTRSK